MSTYEDALRQLTPEAWSKLNEQQKLDTLQAVENEMAAREGRTPCTVKGSYIQSDSRGITMGYYSRADRTITINTEQLDPNSKYGNNYTAHLDTVLHEGRHAYQHQAVLGEVKHDNDAELAAWKDNMKPGHYISYEKNPRGYYAQPIERDARSFAQGATVAVENDKQLLKEKMAMEQNSPKVLRRDPAELHSAGQRNIEAILEVRRDDLRDKGMKDGPEMEQIINRERAQLQAEFQRDAFGSRQTESRSTPGTAGTGGNSEKQVDRDAKRAMFAGSASTTRKEADTGKTETKDTSKDRGMSR